MDWSLLLDAALEHVTVDFSSVCDYVFLIFRFPECDKWVNFWPSRIYLICFHQAGGAHLRNLIHLNEVFETLMDFPSSLASHLDWKQWLEPIPPRLRFTGCGHMVGLFVSPHGNEKSHFILLLPRKDALCRPAQTSHALQLPLPSHGDNVVAHGPPSLM